MSKKKGLTDPLIDNEVEKQKRQIAYEALVEAYGEETAARMIEAAAEPEVPSKEKERSETEINNRIEELYSIGLEYMSEAEKRELSMLRRIVSRRHADRQREMMRKRYRIRVSDRSPMPEDMHERFIEMDVNGRTYRIPDGGIIEAPVDVIDALKNAIQIEHFKTVTADGRKITKVVKKRLYSVEPAYDQKKKGPNVASVEETIALINPGPDEVTILENQSKLPDGFLEGASPAQAAQFIEHFQTYDNMDGFAQGGQAVPGQDQDWR